jgi:hypothetical protein
MAYKEFGYTLKDVDSTLKDYIQTFDSSVNMDGIDTRLRIYESTPDEMLAKKRYPSICIEPGYLAYTPEEWVRPDEGDVRLNPDNDQLLDFKTTRIINLYYGYKVSFYVRYQNHCNYMILKFLEMFPEFVTLRMPLQADDHYSFEFKRSERFINMDQIVDNLKVYRRDVTLTTRLSFSFDYYKSVLRAFNGVQLNNDETILGD